MPRKKDRRRRKVVEQVVFTNVPSANKTVVDERLKENLAIYAMNA